MTATVIAVSKPMKASGPRAGLTDYVIVLVLRATGKTVTRTFRDGHSEPYPSSRKPGELWWQLDTGALIVYPTLGPLWYQLRGWTCIPNDGLPTGDICALVKP